jgi:hypothetical protein
MRMTLAAGVSGFPVGPIYKAGLLADLLSSLDVQEAIMPQSGGLLRCGYFH